MIERLPAHLEASALRRRVEADGGSAMILSKGDPDRGALLLSIVERGVQVAFLERTLTLDGHYRWQMAGPPQPSTNEAIREFIERRRRFDEDLWLIELDVPDAERFIAETIAEG